MAVVRSPQLGPICRIRSTTVLSFEMNNAVVSGGRRDGAVIASGWNRGVKVEE